MRVIGMDVHGAFAQVAILDNGKVVSEQRLELLQDKVVAFGRTLRPDDEVVLATGQTSPQGGLPRTRTEKCVRMTVKAAGNAAETPERTASEVRPSAGTAHRIPVSACRPSTRAQRPKTAVVRGAHLRGVFATRRERRADSRLDQAPSRPRPCGGERRMATSSTLSTTCRTRSTGCSLHRRLRIPLHPSRARDALDDWTPAEYL